MTTTIKPADTDTARATGPERAWIRLLVWVSVVAAAVDLGVPALAGHVIPPLAVGAGLTVVGLLVVRRYPRAGVALLGITNLLLLLSSAPFALPGLAHPESPIGFGHAMVTMVGRPIAVAAAIAAWRRASPAGARRVGIAAAVLLAATVAIGVVSTVLTTGDSAAPGDVTVAARDVTFPDEVRVASGGTVFVENADPLRHTFSVEGTTISLELPERSSLRAEIDLDPGSYRLFCAVPGHESMTGTLIVE